MISDPINSVLKPFVHQKSFRTSFLDLLLKLHCFISGFKQKGFHQLPWTFTFRRFSVITIMLVYSHLDVLSGTDVEFADFFRVKNVSVIHYKKIKGHLISISAHF